MDVRELKRAAAVITFVLGGTGLIMIAVVVDSVGGYGLIAEIMLGLGITMLAVPLGALFMSWFDS